MRKTTSMMRRGAIVVTAAAIVVGTGYVVALADSPDPVLPFSGSVSMVGGNPVLTLTGGWAWTTHNSDCNKDRYAVGYAVDWHDASKAGNNVGTVNNASVNVGTPTDNQVHFVHLAGDTASGADSGDANSTNDPVGATRCGTYSNSLGYNTGTWGPISHTYPKGTTSFQTCLVTYDMHLSGKTASLQSGDDVAGGTKHNGDNSVQGNNKTPLGNQCFTFFIPTITTTTSLATGAVGQGFTDKAVLTGYDPNNPPTGNITFTLHSNTGNDPNDCGGSVVYGPTNVPVSKLSSNPDVYGAVSTPAANPSSVGTYFWQATYSGDSHNAGTSGKCTDDNESTTLNQAQPTITTQVSKATVLVGDTITDTATLADVNPNAAPTGKITFSLYTATNGTGNHCAGTLLTTFTPANDNVGVISAGPTYGATSPSYQATASGDVYWLASYGGDALNLPVAGKCDDSNEKTTVNKSTPGISTSASNTNLKVGDKITDTATLTGLNPNDLPPTGQIHFTLYTTTTNSGNHCGTQVAGYSDDESVVKLSSNPDVYGATTATSYTTLANVTQYFWLASYDGDGYNSGVSGNCGDPGETSNVGLTTPDISTTASTTTAMPGPISDTATLTNYDPNQAPGGTITFSLYSSKDLTNPNGTDCGTLAAGPFTAVPVVSNGAGGYGAVESGVTPPGPGTYYWLAVYSGDGANAAVSGKCSEASEAVTVTKATPTVGTSVSSATVSIGDPITDTATVSGGYQPSGDVTFAIFTDNKCKNPVTTPTFTSTNTLIAGSATSDPYTPAAAGQLYWQATYNGDSNNNSVTEACNANKEETLVDPLTPTMTTSATPLVTLPDPALGAGSTTIQDVATLHGATATAAGTVTFKVYGPHALSTPDCSSGSLFDTVTGTVVNGVAVSQTVPITAAGWYFWVATYGGDLNNNAITLANCGDKNEASNVTQPDLGLDKSGLTSGANPNATILQPGDPINYTVSIPNSGTADVDDATVTDTLPAYVVVDTSSILAGGIFTAGPDITTSAGQIVWNDVDILAGTSTHLTYTVHVASNAPQGEVLTNLVQLGTLSATTTHQVAAGDLSLVKSVDKSAAKYGDTLTYTLKATANGTLVEHDATVADFLPGYDPAITNSGPTTYVDGSGGCTDSGTCTVTYDNAKHQLTWRLGTMNPGQTRTLTFQVTIDTPKTGANGALPADVLYNAAVVTSAENPDPDPSNKVKTTVVAVLGEKVVRTPKTPKTLPFTGMIAPLDRSGGLALILIGVGVVLTVTGRRRRRGAHG